MPPLEPEDICMQYWTMLTELGPALPGFNGEVPLTWSEIDAWARQTGTRIDDDEARLLRALSQTWCQAGRDMRAHDARSAHLRGDQAYLERQRKDTETGLAAAFRSMTAKPKG